MVEKSLTLNEFYSIYSHYLSKKPKNIYQLKRKVNHIMFYKMCTSTHKTKYEKIIKILKNRNLFSKNKKNKCSKTCKIQFQYTFNRRNNTRSTSPISYLLM